MAILGGNILKMAMSVVGSESILYMECIGLSEPNAKLKRVPIYATPRAIKAQIQPISRALFQQMGLDFQKSYVKVWSENMIRDVERDASSDQLIYGGKKFQVMSNDDWKRPQGFVGALAVQLDA